RSSREVLLPQQGSFVTEPCRTNTLSPLRNCGFTELPADDLSCIPGETVERTFTLQEEAELQALRVCERSAELGEGIACTFEESLANRTIGREPTTVSFTCPPIRDAAGTEGGYALFAAPIWPEELPPAMTADSVR
ncbi:MAG: hypothetical protein R3293_17745, partial [Candidatus Promineifilaceae bacterium]|nr:hypothetical protein [Candidatus Promineifilaceae bacterium]